MLCDISILKNILFDHIIKTLTNNDIEYQNITSREMNLETKLSLHFKYKPFIFNIEYCNCFAYLLCCFFFVCFDAFWVFHFVCIHPMQVIDIILSITHAIINEFISLNPISKQCIVFILSEEIPKHVDFGDILVNKSVFSSLMIAWIWNTLLSSNWHISSIPSA